MASPGYELLSWAVLPLALLYKVIDACFDILHVQCATFSDQLLDIEIAEPRRAGVVRNVQRDYRRAHQLNHKKHGRQIRGSYYILVTHMPSGPERTPLEPDRGVHHE